MGKSAKKYAKLCGFLTTDVDFCILFKKQTLIPIPKNIGIGIMGLGTREVYFVGKIFGGMEGCRIVALNDLHQKKIAATDSEETGMPVEITKLDFEIN